MQTEIRELSIGRLIAEYIVDTKNSMFVEPILAPEASEKAMWLPSLRLPYNVGGQLSNRKGAPMSRLSERRDFATEVCEEAGRLAKKLFADRVNLIVDQKGAQDWVSEAAKKL